MGIAGIAILVVLVSISIGAVVLVPVETFQQWNNPQSWISYPKTAMPSWVNLFVFEKIPEHKILDSPNVMSNKQGEISALSHQFNVNYVYDDFPSDFIYEFTAKYSGSPLLQITVLRPDGSTLRLLSESLPHSNEEILYNARIFSADNSIKKNLLLQSDQFDFPLEGFSAEDIVFAQSSEPKVLK